MVTSPSPSTLRLLGFLLALALGVTALTASAGEDADLPDVLRRHGFGDAETPITVVFVSPVGEEEDQPKLAGSNEVAPRNTLWVFEDPAPIRAVLARAKTRSFGVGRIPGAEARIILYAGPEGADGRIYLSYRPGWGVVKKDRKTGGEWYFDSATDRALVELLSRTKPRAVGHPVIGVIEAAWKPELRVSGPDFGTFAVRGDWARLKQRVVPRYASAKLALPEWFSWDTHFVAVAWLAPRDSRDRLDWGNARVAEDTVTWALREDREKEEAKGYAPVTIGFFQKLDFQPPHFPRFAMSLDGKVVKSDALFPRMPMPDDPKHLAALLVPRDADGVRIGTISILSDRTWWYEPDADDKEGSACRGGRIPPSVAGPLFGGLGAWKTHQGRMAMHDVRLGSGDAFPPGTRELLRHLGLVK
jgi:hypothetical protein